MKRIKFIFILLLLAVLLGACSRSEYPNRMKLKSEIFKSGEAIPVEYTCDGNDINPPLSISRVPKDAKSLVLIMDDPDAPGGAWLHWLVWNIDPKTKEIAANSVPQDAVLGMTDFGSPRYGGPCPPSGTHRYYFKLYALDARLDLTAGSGLDELEKAMLGHILDKAELYGDYGK